MDVAGTTDGNLILMGRHLGWRQYPLPRLGYHYSFAGVTLTYWSYLRPGFFHRSSTRTVTMRRCTALGVGYFDCYVDAERSHHWKHTHFPNGIWIAFRLTSRARAHELFSLFSGLFLLLLFISGLFFDSLFLYFFLRCFFIYFFCLCFRAAFLCPSAFMRNALQRGHCRKSVFFLTNLAKRANKRNEWSKIRFHLLIRSTIGPYERIQSYTTSFYATAPAQSEKCSD